MLAVLALVVADIGAAPAQTLPAVLAKAYQSNPQLNAQRAFVRQTEEQVQVALSGYHPRISATASGGPQYTDGQFRGVEAHAAIGSTAAVSA